MLVRQARGNKPRWAGLSDIAAEAPRDYVERFRGPRRVPASSPVTASRSLPATRCA